MAQLMTSTAAAAEPWEDAAPAKARRLVGLGVRFKAPARPVLTTSASGAVAV